MDHEHPAENNSEESGSGAPPNERVEPINSPTAENDSKKELDTIKDELTCFEKSTIRWARTSAVMAGLAALCVAAQWWEMRTESKKTERPWVAFSASPSPTIELPFTPTGDNTAKITIDYSLSNFGHQPAVVYISAKVAEYKESDQSPSEQANSECANAKGKFDRHPITVVPGVPSIYGVHYDGKQSTHAMESMEPVSLNPGHGLHPLLINIGCVVYQSTDGGSIRSTPFEAYVSTGDPNLVYNLSVIGNAK